MINRLSPLARASIRVALAATGVTAALLLVVSVVTDVVVQHSIVSDIDNRLTQRLSDIENGVTGNSQQQVPRTFSRGDQEVVNLPIAVWVYDNTGSLVAQTPQTPELPSESRQVSGPIDISLNGTDFRVDGVKMQGFWVMTGQSLAVADDDVGKLVTTELLVAPLILILVFAGALTIGRRVARPIAETHARQLAFTADASHELRTPLSVIEAETALALEKARKPQEYRATLERIGTESGRLRHIVDALLWLARFDAAPQTPGSEPVDLATVVDNAHNRFTAVAVQRQIDLTVVHDDNAALIVAPPDWVERLTGVLFDNACKYTPAGGKVRATVAAEGGRVSLSVEDSGPGIPQEERSRIFNRFHRASGHGDGAGLGLAIGNAVVGATGATWDVGVSDLGGARFTVSWSASH